MISYDVDFKLKIIQCPTGFIDNEIYKKLRVFNKKVNSILEIHVVK